VDGVLSKRIAISIRPALSTTLPFSSLSARTAERDSLSACDNDSLSACDNLPSSC